LRDILVNGHPKFFLLCQLLNTLDNDYYLKKEKEILEFYEKHYPRDNKAKNYIDTYLNLLKCCEDLGSANPLKREKSLSSLPSFVDSFLAQQKEESEELAKIILQEFFEFVAIMSKSLRWEDRAGAINISSVLLQKANFEEHDVKFSFQHITIPKLKIFEVAMNILLQEKEFRFREPIYQYIQKYIEKYGEKPIEQTKESLFEHIETSWKKYEDFIEEEASQPKTIESNPLIYKEKLKARSNINQEIEAYYKILSAMLNSLGNDSKILDEKVLAIIYRTQNHDKQEIRSLG